MIDSFRFLDPVPARSSGPIRCWAGWCRVSPFGQLLRDRFCRVQPLRPTDPAWPPAPVHHAPRRCLTCSALIAVSRSRRGECSGWAVSPSRSPLWFSWLAGHRVASACHPSSVPFPVLAYLGSRPRATTSCRGVRHVDTSVPPGTFHLRPYRSSSLFRALLAGLARGAGRRGHRRPIEAPLKPPVRCRLGACSARIAGSAWGAGLLRRHQSAAWAHRGDSGLVFAIPVHRRPRVLLSVSVALNLSPLAPEPASSTKTGHAGSGLPRPSHQPPPVSRSGRSRCWTKIPGLYG